MGYPTYNPDSASIPWLIETTVQINKVNGWYDQDVSLPEMIALLHSEVSEALEAWRNGESISWTDDNEKPQGVASEFADIAIRLFDYSARLGIDLTAEINRKLVYNSKRSYRHGGKRN